MPQATSVSFTSWGGKTTPPSQGGSGLGEKPNQGTRVPVVKTAVKLAPSWVVSPRQRPDVGLDCVNFTELGWGRPWGFQSLCCCSLWSVTFHHEHGLLLVMHPPKHMSLDSIRSF